MYYLNKKERSADLSGDYIVWYLNIGTENSERLVTLPSRTNKRPKVITFSGLVTSSASK